MRDRQRGAIWGMILIFASILLIVISAATMAIGLAPIVGGTNISPLVADIPRALSDRLVLLQQQQQFREQQRLAPLRQQQAELGLREQIQQSRLGLQQRRVQLQQAQ